MDTGDLTARKRVSSTRGRKRYGDGTREVDGWVDGIQRRTYDDGSVKWTALVRVRPFHARSKTFSERDAAKRWSIDEKRKLEAEREAKGKENARPELTSLTVGQLVVAYLEDPGTKRLRSYKDSVARLAWWVNELGDKRLREVGVPLLRDARSKLARNDIAPATINRYLSALRSAWNWGIAAEYIADRQAWPKKLILKEQNARQRHLDDGELDDLLREAKAYDATLHAAIFVSIACGLRKGELLKLRWADVDFENSSLRILLTKTDDPRGVHLPLSAADALRGLKRATVVATHVFITEKGKPANQHWIERHWRRVRDAAGLKNFRWHDLRHSCASLLAQNGSSLLEIGTVLGHKSPVTTKRYAHLVTAKPVTGHAALNAKLSGK